MLSGSAACTSSESRKSSSAWPPSGLSAPASTPAYSTCWKQVSSRALVVDSSVPFGTVNAGEES